MAAETNYWKLGLFITASAAVGLVVLAFFASKKQEVHRVHFFFDEAVDGLARGSDVRYRGINIGAVKELRAAPDRRHVHILADLFIETVESLGFRERGHMHTPEEFKAAPLRGYLERNPLTGIAVIQMERYEEGKVPPPADYPFKCPDYTIYTVPSVVKGLIADLTATLSSVPSAIEDARRLIHTLNASIRDAKVGETIEEIRNLAHKAGERFAELDVSGVVAEAEGLAADGRQTLKSIDAALEEVRLLAANLRAAEGPLNRFLSTYTRLGETAEKELVGAKIPDTTASVRGSLSSADEVSEEARRTLQNVQRDLEVFARAAEAIRRLAALLERDPAALLRGRPVPASPTKGQ